jgi:hypothetical protein
MKNLFLTCILAMSASSLTSAAEPTPSTPLTPSRPGIIYHDCSPIEAELEQMADQMKVKRQECDGIYQELLELTKLKKEAETKAQLPNSTVEDGYAYFNLSQTWSRKAKDYNTCDDQLWAIFRERANLMSKCK